VRTGQLTASGVPNRDGDTIHDDCREELPIDVSLEECPH
jgi:hypothetical protein